MTIPVFISRPAALGVGVTTVLGTSLLIPEPYLRTLLVWVGFFPVLWALRPLPSEQKRAGAKRAIGAAAEEAAIAVEEFARAARRLDGKKGRGQGAATAPRPAPALDGSSAASAPRFAADDPLASALLTPRPPGPSAGNAPFTSERKYLGLRRLTEQYLREIRRMNLVAVWGREGSIPKNQALDQIREIERRMRYLSERMKLVAGRVQN